MREELGNKQYEIVTLKQQLAECKEQVDLYEKKPWGVKKLLNLPRIMDNYDKKKKEVDVMESQIKELQARLLEAEKN